MEITIEHLQPYLLSLTTKQKDKLLEKLLKKDKLLMEQLYFKHMSAPEELDARYLEFEDKVKDTLFARYRGPSDELEMAKGIGEAKKVINQFTKIDKRPEKEAELLILILEIVFNDANNPASFGTCWSKYDLSVTQTLKRLITIIRTKLHEDHLLDYKSAVDSYLAQIWKAAGFHDFVWELPKEL